MKFVPNGIARTVSRQILIQKKNSPRTMFALGIVGVGVSTVLACRATLKLHSTLDDVEQDVEIVKDIKEAHPDILAASYYKELGLCYAKGGYKIVRLYGPSILIGTTSVALLTGSHVALSRRNASLTAAYSALSMSFDAYRDRVREELGEEKERDTYLGIHNEKVMLDGKLQQSKVVDPNGYSMYAVIFDELNPNYQKNPEYNKVFIRAQQAYFNNLLLVRGHVFLNEVYDHLGFDHTAAGSLVGWSARGDGDCFIDFGIYDVASARFVNGHERAVVLDFNVDGNIWNLI